MVAGIHNPIVIPQFDSPMKPLDSTHIMTFMLFLRSVSYISVTLFSTDCLQSELYHSSNDTDFPDFIRLRRKIQKALCAKEHFLVSISKVPQCIIGSTDESKYALKFQVKGNCTACSNVTVVGDLEGHVHNEGDSTQRQWINSTTLKSKFMLSIGDSYIMDSKLQTSTRRAKFTFTLQKSTNFFQVLYSWVPRKNAKNHSKSQYFTSAFMGRTLSRMLSRRAIKYYKLNEGSSWKDRSDLCKEIKMTLPSIHSIEDSLNFIQNFAHQKQIRPQFVFIGLSRTVSLYDKMLRQFAPPHK